MNKQRGGLLTTITLLQALAAAALIGACVPVAVADTAIDDTEITDPPAFGLVEVLQNGKVVSVVAVGAYDTTTECDADIHARASHGHAVRGVEFKYLCVPVASFETVKLPDPIT